MKKRLLLLALLLILASIFTVPTFAKDVKVFINNEQQYYNQKPVIKNGATLIPMRAIFEALGCTINWDSKTKTVTGNRDDTKVQLTIGAKNGYVNGSPKSLLEKAQLINNHTYVPLRFIGEALGDTVVWDGKTSTINITSSKKVTGAGFGKKLMVHFIDVGQGDSILITAPNGSTMLIDAGTRTAGQKVVSYLKSAGITSIDWLVATHPHEDHIGGMELVVNSFNVKNVTMPKVAHTTKTYEDLLLAIKNKDLKINQAKGGQTINLDPSLDLKILAPNSDTYKSLNNYSVVLKLVYNQNSFLFTGDAEDISENEMIAAGYNLKSNVLKVGHHGSNTSTTSAFLDKVAPGHGVISVGQGNSYGHPTEQTLNRLTNAQVKVYRTDTSGNIVATSDGVNITFNTKPSAPSTVTPENATTDKDQIVYITKTGAKYHKDGCSSLSKSKIPIKLSEAKAKGYEPCKTCKPAQ